MEYYLALKRNEVLTHCMTWVILGEHHAEGKKPDTKGHKLYDSTSVKCPGQTDLRGREVSPGCLGLWRTGRC